MIMKFDSYNWRTFEVDKPEKKPKGEHYGVVLLDTRSEYTPPYGKHDSGGSCNVPDVMYYAFVNKEDLEMFLGEASKANKNFFFFHVAKLGEVNLQVKINTDL